MLASVRRLESNVLTHPTASTALRLEPRSSCGLWRQSFRRGQRLARLGALFACALMGGAARGQGSFDWSFDGSQAGAGLGFAVAAAGDVNGDGFADMLVGARDLNAGLGSEGAAYLFLGSATGFATTPDWTFVGNQQGALAGSALSAAGDVNLDGFDDVLVGARGFDSGATDAGRVYLFLGASNGLAVTPAWVFDGTQANEGFGNAVSAGDFDGDGWADVVIGAPGYSNGEQGEGCAVVFNGPNFSTTPSWTVEGEQTGASLGGSVACAGDVNADGVMDLLVGSQYMDGQVTDGGAAFLFMGSLGGLAATASWTTAGAQSGCGVGNAVASSNDVDGDGFCDVLVAAQRFDGPAVDEGMVMLFRGSATGLSAVPAWTATGGQPGALFGNAVCAAGFVNDDAYADVIIGARYHDQSLTNEGSANLYLGGPAGLQLAPVARYVGGQAGAELGIAVAGIGDCNLDGSGDIAVGAWRFDVGQPDMGRVLVDYGIAYPPAIRFVDASAASPGHGTAASPYARIDFAVAHPTTKSGDTVQIAAGTYFERVDSRGKALTIESVGGPGVTTIDAQGAGSTVTIRHSGALPFLLRGLTITGGNTRLTDHDSGGGVYCTSDTLTIIDCIITGNSADYCGGVYLSGSAIFNSTVSNNSTNAHGDCFVGSGGGICGGSTITNCRIEGNVAVSNGGGVWGGALSGCVVIGNSAQQGGGLYQSVATGCEIRQNQGWSCDDSSGVGGGAYESTLVECSVFQNVADAAGGGAAFSTLARCDVIGNSCGAPEPYQSDFGGGGAFESVLTDCRLGWNVCYPEDPQNPGTQAGGGANQSSLDRCVLIGNESDYGGGIANSNAARCTVYGNRARLAGGGLYAGQLTSGILWMNSPSSVDPSSLPMVSYSTVDGGWPGTGNINADPLFVNQAFGDLHLTALSPCIDAGDPLSPLDPDGSRADMGAFPYDPNYCPLPFAYCTAKTNSCGAQPSIAWTGSPNLSATTPFVITATGARAARPGILLYSPNGMANSPFQGGTLCIAAQGLRRSPQVTSIGGSGGAACDAAFSIDWTAFALGGLGGTPQPYLRQLGQRVNVQWWGRDNLVVGSFLSNAIQYEVCP